MTHSQPDPTVGPGADLDSAEGADLMQTKDEAEEVDTEQRDDLQEEDIITLDAPD